MSHKHVSETSEIAIELLDNSRTPCCALSRRGTVVYWNKGAEKEHSATAETKQLAASSIELVIPADRCCRRGEVLQ